MKKKAENKLKRLNASVQEECSERIANGTWMGRGTVFKSEKAYDRKREKRIVREAVSER